MSIDTVLGLLNAKPSSTPRSLPLASKPFDKEVLDPSGLLVDSVVVAVRVRVSSRGSVVGRSLGVALRRGDVEVDVLSGDGAGLGVLGTVDVVLLQHDLLLVSGQLGHLLGDQGGSSVGQVGSSEDDVDLRQFTTTGLRVEQPDEGEGDGVLDSEQEEGPTADRCSYEAAHMR